MKSHHFCQRLAAVLSLFLASARAEEVGNCTVPENCVDASLELVFAPSGSSRRLRPAVGEEIEVQARIDVAILGIQAYSYGVAHDPTILEILSVTHKGAHRRISESEFKTTKIAQDKLGFVQAVVVTLDEVPPFDLPVENDVVLAIAKYRVLALPADVSKICFAHGLRPPGSPPGGTNLTFKGRPRQPRSAQCAQVWSGDPVCEGLPDFAFYFGEDPTLVEVVANARDISIGMRNAVPVFGFSLGIRRLAGELFFDGTIGRPAVPLAMLREAAGEISGTTLRGNRAIQPDAQFVAVERGAALAGNAPGDFLAVETLREIGSTVRYAADTTGSGKAIPPTPGDPATSCSLNPVLTLSVVEPFVAIARGDANGDGQLSISDGVLLVQNILFSKQVVFSCGDMLDANDDGQLDISDPIVLLIHLFLQGPPPSSPSRACGADLTSDLLGCKQSNCL